MMTTLLNSEVSWKSFGLEILRITIVATIVSLLFNFLIYPQLGLGENVPMPARTLAIWITITWILRKKEESWKQFGLCKTRRIGRVLLVAFGLIAYELLLSGPLTDFALNLFNQSPADYSSFSFIQGNLPALIYFIILSWAIGGFVEEMIFRGYLMTRFQKLFSNRLTGVFLSILFQAIIFGSLHLYQGAGGVIATGLNGLVFGIAFQLSGRNLWAGIVIHALMDTAGILLIYFNGVPSFQSGVV